MKTPRMKTPEARKLIGKTIEWRTPTSFYVRRGVIEEVKNKNILISGDWHWLPDMKEIKVIENPDIY